MGSILCAGGWAGLHKVDFRKCWEGLTYCMQSQPKGSWGTDKLETLVLTTQNLELERERKNTQKHPKGIHNKQQLQGTRCVSRTHVNRKTLWLQGAESLSESRNAGQVSKSIRERGGRSRQRRWLGHRFRGKKTSTQRRVLHSKPRRVGEGGNTSQQWEMHLQA